MGLDMYIKRQGREDETAFYWRKANQIREWFRSSLCDFEDNGQTLVTRDDLFNLLYDINCVLEDNSLAESILPTSSGFFFGDTAYDDWYFEELVRTKAFLEEELDTSSDSDIWIYGEWY